MENDAQQQKSLIDEALDTALASAFGAEAAFGFEEATAGIARTIGNLFYAIYHIRLDDFSYICLREGVEAVLSAVGAHGNMAEAFAIYIDRFIEPEFREGMRGFSNLETLAVRLAESSSLSYEYRRVGIGWTRCQFLVSQRNDEGRATHVVFVVSDITAEKALVERERKARYSAQHDVLTGVLNRAAFKEIVVSELYAGSPVCFALIDVDDFKSLNDEHGHRFGDEVLSNVASALKDAFRADDRVFRIGGDEFAVILKDCPPSSWGALCKKFKRIHQVLSVGLSDGEDVTLSVGVCFGSSGYENWMVEAADKGLYHTKEKGRAGCTLVRAGGTVVDSWRDDEATVRTFSAFEGSHSGAGRIEFSLDRSGHPRFFCGESLKKLYGMPDGMTPEDRFDYWMSGVDSSSTDILMKARNEVLKNQNVECTFLWSKNGIAPFLVRAAGSAKTVDGMAVVYGINRSLEGAKLIEKTDNARLIVQAQNNIYVSSYYLDIEADAITPLKQTDCAAKIQGRALGACDTLKALMQELIDEAYRDKMLDFSNLKTLSKRMGDERSLDCDFLSATGQGWCRASWLPVKRNQKGEVTHALFVVASLDAAREAEIASEQETAELMGLHYEAVRTVLNSQILEMVLFDRVTGIGREWRSETGFSSPSQVDFDLLRKRHAGFASAEDQEKFAQQTDRDLVLEQIDDAGSYSVPAVFELPSGESRYLVYHFSQYSKNPRMVMTVVEDATERIKAQRDLAMTTDSLEAALKASNQMIWEYDPVSKAATCYTEANALGLPKRIENYPESLRELRVFDEENAAIFQEAVSKIDAGAAEARCDVLIRVNDKDRWFSCKLYSRFDSVLGRRLATFFVTDISLRMSAIRAFEERMESLLYSDESVLKAGIFNLTKGKLTEIHAQERVLPPGTDFGYDETLEAAAQGIVDPEERLRYIQMFSRANMIALSESGKRHTSMECLYQVKPGYTEWAEASAELVCNPVSGDLEVIGRIRSINELRLSGMLVKESLRGGRNSAAILFHHGSEYYLFDGESKSVCVHRADYWSDLDMVLDALCDVEEKERVLSLVAKERVLAELAEGRGVKTTFLSTYYGERTRIELSFSSGDSRRGIIFVTVRDITDGVVLEQLRYDSRHDALTGLYNRQTLFARCRELLDEHPEQTFVLFKFNVRRFRMFNAFFGEKAGDGLICAIADTLREIADDYGCGAYGRIESDIFCGFFPQDKVLFLQHIELVRQRLSSYRADFRLEPSVGVYVVTDRSLPVEGMFARASSAAKEGGTKVCDFARCYNDELEKKLKHEIAIANTMHSALEEGQFAVYLQPKFDLQTGANMGAEALVRWIHPERGMISPGSFIPVFESNGFIASLDRYMWESVCRLLRMWCDEGRTVRPVSVNVSRVSAYSPSTVPFLKDLVKRYGVDPALLELELTESAYIDQPEVIRRSMRALQDEGFKILMDDFGSGYSSLNTLRNLPVDILKLDMGFLSDEDDDERGRTVVSSIMDMTKRLGLPVIAEGVETVEQADYLRSIGCAYVQGYLYARPMPVEDYERLE